MEDPCRAWKAFGSCLSPLIPVIIRQMQAVTEQTEAAALNLMAKLNGIAQRAAEQAEHAAPKRAEELGRDIGQIVMALQFQDITRQKLEHVGHALTQVQGHVVRLLEGKPDADIEDSLALLKELEHSYTMEAERRVHAEVNGKPAEPAPATPSAGEEDSVTLF
jgi:hypothetical protein